MKETTMAKGKSHGHKGARSSETGQFVPLKEADKHPKTTQKETIPNPGYGDTGRSKKKK
jgi:hypothetical protein